MNYIEFDFETESTEQSEQLIALLSEQDFEGFEEEENYLKAFIAENKFDEEEFERIVSKFSSLIYTSSIIENINWNQQWEESFQPVIVEDIVGIRAGFHQPIKKMQHEIIITPKMSFGTGHHATTYLMIQLMLSIDFKNKNVIDFGTGTGVLAILAEKLGASKILAIDYDEWSIENAKENITQNHCTKIVLQQNSVFPATGNFDITLANITLNVISANITLMSGAIQKSAKIVLSGFLKSDEGSLGEILTDNKFTLITSFQRGNWIAILAEKD
jgi:ribosomal protein L11 methyltransferase